MEMDSCFYLLYYLIPRNNINLTLIHVPTCSIFIMKGRKIIKKDISRFEIVFYKTMVFYFVKIVK